MSEFQICRCDELEQELNETHDAMLLARDERNELEAVLNLFLTAWQADCAERAAAYLAQYASARKYRLECEEKIFIAEMETKLKDDDGSL